MDVSCSNPLSQVFADFVTDPAFPCIGAKSALAHDGIKIVIGRDIRKDDNDVAIYIAIVAQARERALQPDRLVSLVVVFEDQTNLDEIEFECALWQRLSALVKIDIAREMHWSPAASSDPQSADFAMSVAGQAYFIVGLHRGASRAARAFSRCAIVFNAHEQFDAMRLDGRYQRFQSINRSREHAQVGSINPMLTDFGMSSEAPQYSGRQVDANWTCPMFKEKIIA